MRRTGIKRTAWPKRRKALPRVNHARRDKLFQRAYGERGGPIRAMRCLVVDKECQGPIEAAHTVSKARGGTRRDLVPLCRLHHRRQHRLGWPAFARRYDINPKEAAAWIALQLDALGIP